MRLPAMPVRSGRDATLNFEKLVRPKWTPVQFSGNWTNFGSGVFANAEWTYLGGLIVVRGLVTKPTKWEQPEPIFIGLPPPERREGFCAFGGDSALGTVAVRLDMTTLGSLETGGAVPAGVTGTMTYVFTNFSYVPKVA